MSYNFGGCLYRTQGDLLEAIASEWITGGGTFRGAAALQGLEGETDEWLADECIANWELDTAWDVEIGSQMTRWGITRDDLVEAMAEYRARLEADADEAADGALETHGLNACASADGWGKLGREG
jgi:uncharacterized protein (DUF2235 family)